MVLLLQVVRAHLIFKGIISNHVTSFQFILTQVGHLFSKTSLNVSFLTSHFIINQLSIISDYFADINYTVWSNSTTGTRTAGMPFHPISLLPLLPLLPLSLPLLLLLIFLKVIEDVKCPPGRTSTCVHFGVTYCDSAPPCYRSGMKKSEREEGERKERGRRERERRGREREAKQGRWRERGPKTILS